MKEAVCERCGKVFRARMTHGRWPRFCSRKCWSPNPKKKQSYVCKSCGKSFSRLPRGKAKRRFCSRECASEAKRKQPQTRNCENCGKPYVPKRKTSRFCSLECAWKAQATGKNLVCAVCGKTFWATLARQRDGAECCSTACSAPLRESRTDRQLIDNRCEECGTTFKTRPCDKRRFCSKACAYSARRKPGGVDKTCPVCGMVFRVTPCMAAARVTCGATCRDKLAAMRKEAKMVDGVCARCGKAFRYVQHHHSKVQLFCSAKCKTLKAIHKCRVCHKVVRRPFSAGDPQFCSRACQKIGTRFSGGSQWNGGISRRPDGRVYVITKKRYDNGAAKYALHHRRLVEREIGRSLDPNGHPIIHLNGDRSDNRLENLYVCADRSEASRIGFGHISFPRLSNVKQLANAYAAIAKAKP